MRSLTTGTIIGNYRIISEIGAGGLGRVFKAVHLQNHAIVALKVIHDRFYCNSKFIGFFHREMLTHAGLHHKNIVRHYESCFKPPRCYISTEFIDGWSGSLFIKRHREIPPLVALSIVFQILQGLDCLHLHDAVHADLSAGNFLIERSGRVALTDFGLAGYIADDGVGEHKNYLIGTPGYYSPEHVSNAGIGYSSDTYCVGLILYELIAGHRAVVASKNRRIVVSNMRKISLDLPCSDRRMKKMLNKVLQRALRYDKDKRYQTAEQMIYDCSTILKNYGIKFPMQIVLYYLAQKDPTIDAPPIAINIYQGLINNGSKKIA